MATTLDESGLIVAFEADQQHALLESGLIVTFQAEPVHRLLEGGIIIVTEEQAPPSGETVLIQGEEMRRHYTLQGAAFDPGPFFPEPG